MKHKSGLKSYHPNINKGFSILEVVLAAAIFCIFSTVALSFSLQALQAERRANQSEIALGYATEGIEAVRAVRDVSFDNLSNTDGSGLRFSDGHWQLDGDHDDFGVYRRVITINQVQRDGDGNIVSDGGTEDLNMKRAVSSVSFLSPSGEQVSVNLDTYLSRWK
jgi:prepilin-type N-terminal cleavage/methylation domain-containing protein